MNLNLCKYLFSVSKRAPHLALYGELGRLLFILIRSAVWSGTGSGCTMKKCGGHLLGDALKDNLVLFKSGHYCWVKKPAHYIRRYRYEACFS